MLARFPVSTWRPGLPRMFQSLRHYNYDLLLPQFGQEGSAFVLPGGLAANPPKNESASGNWAHLFSNP